MLVEFILYTTIATSEYEVYCLTPADEQLFSYSSEHSRSSCPNFPYIFQVKQHFFSKIIQR